MHSSASMHMRVFCTLAFALSLSACAPAENSNGKKLQTMMCAGDHSISFYEQREFDKACIAHIERTRDNAPTE